jgi:hypothetical protein
MYVNIAIILPPVLLLVEHALLRYFFHLVLIFYDLFRLINHNNGIKVALCIHHIFLAAVANSYRQNLIYIYLSIDVI